jgi:hypothetical protein
MDCVPASDSVTNGTGTPGRCGTGHQPASRWIGARSITPSSILECFRPSGTLPTLGKCRLPTVRRLKQTAEKNEKCGENAESAETRGGFLEHVRVSLKQRQRLRFCQERRPRGWVQLAQSTASRFDIGAPGSWTATAANAGGKDHQRYNELPEVADRQNCHVVGLGCRTRKRFDLAHKTLHNFVHRRVSCRAEGGVQAAVA